MYKVQSTHQVYIRRIRPLQSAALASITKDLKPSPRLPIATDTVQALSCLQSTPSAGWSLVLVVTPTQGPDVQRWRHKQCRHRLTESQHNPQH